MFRFRPVLFLIMCLTYSKTEPRKFYWFYEQIIHVMMELPLIFFRYFVSANRIFFINILILEYFTLKFLLHSKKYKHTRATQSVKRIGLYAKILGSMRLAFGRMTNFFFYLKGVIMNWTICGLEKTALQATQHHKFWL